MSACIFADGKALSLFFINFVCKHVALIVYYYYNFIHFHKHTIERTTYNTVNWKINERTYTVKQLQAIVFLPTANAKNI